ncbi:MAG: endonuclease III [Chloroflexota bacterium]|nr:MAG: endonuclease III [Chloroflexota bacterium]
MTDEGRLAEIIEKLDQVYGRHVWRPRADPVSELVLTILSQHTSDVNSHRAFEGLIGRFGSLERVRSAAVEEIAEAVRSAGLSNVKAPRIKEVLNLLVERHGSLELGFLAEMDLDEARRWLTDLPGVGPKTAACVLLFSLDRPALPVDTHVYRVARRLALFDPRTTPDQAHRILEGMVPPAKVYDFHLNMIAHGRRVCKAPVPICPRCVLECLCPKVGVDLSAVAARFGSLVSGGTLGQG